MDAVTMLTPLASDQAPTVATPLLPVVATPPVTLPPPPVTVNVTLAPTIGLPSTSSSCTAGGVLTGKPASPSCERVDSPTRVAGHASRASELPQPDSMATSRQAAPMREGGARTGRRLEAPAGGGGGGVLAQLLL